MDPLAFLGADGEMAGRIRRHDWAATSLGPPEGWPQSLRTVLRLALTTRHPMFVFWGSEHLCFYNDGYRPSLGPEKHPSILGAPGQASFGELWDIIGPQIALVMRGEGATWHENHLVPSYRHGRLDEVYWTYSYGPIDDESAPNGVGGVLVVCTETTRQMKIEAALRESERQLQRMNDELEERVSAAIAARIREQKRLAEAEETLRQAQKVETLGQLTGGVAHDFNNLLTPVMGALDFARFALDRDADAQEVIAVGLQAADRARTLVQRLLAFSRRQHLAPRDVGIDALIDNVVELAQRSLRPGLLLSTEVEPGLPDVRVDPDQLVLALLNLVVNARDAIPGHGSIAIRAGEDRDPSRTRMGEGRFLRIDVVDDGAGMDGDTLRRAAEPFFTTKEPGRGTGLGLSSVQGLAMQSGGDFQLRSASGSGTTASLWLPLSASASTPAGAAEADAASGPARSPAARILLVDDDPLVRASAAGTLRRAGYEVHEAVDAASALAALRDGRLPDLLLSDHAMPGMPGMDLLRQVRREWPALPCMLVTGYADDLGEDVPGVERLPKPFLPRELVEAVARAIARSTEAA